MLLRPAYIAIEFVVAASTNGGYSFVDDSVSTLGQVGCTPAYCSPDHALMNAAFVGFGALLAIGAVLLRRSLGAWGTVLLVISGLSSIATGLAPLDQDETLHAVVAMPLFVAQPTALLVLAVQSWPMRPGLAGMLLAAGGVTGIAALAFVLNGGGVNSGLFERLALWPVLVALAGVGWSRLRLDVES